MVNRGARNLILLSRSGPGNELGVALVKELEEKGVRVATPTCDIANASALQNALAACFQTMPPIKGCFQATAVLRVGRHELHPPFPHINMDLGCYVRANDFRRLESLR